MTDFLDHWLKMKGRRPLVIRGARQVGKTWAARDLAQRHGKVLVELNFERDPRHAQVFRSHDPKAILDTLGLGLGIDITPSTARRRGGDEIPAPVHVR